MDNFYEKLIFEFPTFLAQKSPLFYFRIGSLETIQIFALKMDIFPKSGYGDFLKLAILIFVTKKSPFFLKKSVSESPKMTLPIFLVLKTPGLFQKWIFFSRKRIFGFFQELTL